MAETIMMPNLGLDMEEGTILNWVKQVGDSVKKGDVILEIEADKATIEVEATAAGTLTKQLVKVNDVVKIGAPIAEIGEGGAAAASAPAPAAAPASTPAPAAPAPAASTPAAAPAAAPVSTSLGEEFPGGVKASPIARRIAEERGLDLRLIQGTGPGGRISKSDVENYKPAAAAPVEQGVTIVTQAQPSAATVATYAPKKIPTGAGITEEPLTRMRAIIATRMVESKQTVPHFYVTTEIDMEAAVALRKQINDGLPEEQKISVNDMIVKATALALRQYPNLNSHFYGDRIVRFEHINIGIAVALDNGGLLNVVAKDADMTTLSRMAQRNKQMIANARSGKVKPEDIEGSTFTVSNLGPFDVEHFLAIINPPEAGIIAVGSAKEVPVVVNGQLTIGTRMKCTLSVDHRVSDGAEGAKYMQAFKALLETPMRLLV